MTRPDTRYAEARFRATDARQAARKDHAGAILHLAAGLEVLVQAILTDKHHAGPALLAGPIIGLDPVRADPTPGDGARPTGETSRNTVQATRCEHEFTDASPLVSYSPASHRWCADCGLVQVLTFGGWFNLCRVTVEDSAAKVARKPWWRRWFG